VLHPGSHGGDGEKAGIRRAIASIDRAHAATRGFKARVLVETSSGQGRSICSSFEALGTLLRDVEEPRRLGACVDTCHIFAAGYELRSRSGYAATLEALESAIGLDKVFCVHANDSKGELGSRVDRHEHIGRGRIGRDGFRNLVNDRRFEGIPMIIELPPEGDMPRVNLRTLRSLVRQGSRGRHAQAAGMHGKSTCSCPRVCNPARQ
jgi:deoxyribonuclease-4